MSNIRTGLLITSNNIISDIELDMTEHTDNISEFLDDNLTFIGQILREPYKCNAVIISGKNSKLRNLDKNMCNIPPFKDDIFGPIFIICMDENSEPQNFTKDDLDEYIKNYETLYKKIYYD